MRIHLTAVGRMKSGPERELAARFFERFEKTAPSIGLEFAGISEFPESRAREVEQRKAEEAVKLNNSLPPGSVLVLLDERGKNISSADFARMIAKNRDSGTKSMVFAIGGADGHAETLRENVHGIISFGAMTFPHQIMRILIAEQFYRAVTILSGHPYHRE